MTKLNNDNLKQAILLFESAKYEEALLAFQELKAYYEAGFCSLLIGKPELAEELYNLEKQDTPALLWGKAFLNMILKRNFIPIPFFQIRNYLERDINLLLNNNLLEYAQNILDYSDLIAQCNPETYKFIGRVLINNNYFEPAKQYLEKSLDIYYNDPEVHVMLAKYWLFNENIQLARHGAKTALKVSPEYFPAQKLLDNLNNL